ncbi:hypothetical protein NUM3379_03510 [Kineococcus sp. NUM-3379]
MNDPGPGAPADVAEVAEEPTWRAQRREQVLFERERATARRRAQRVPTPAARSSGRALPRPFGEEFEAGWWTVEQQVPVQAADGADPAATAPARGPAPEGAAPLLPGATAAEVASAAGATATPVTAAVTTPVTVPVTVPMTVPADVWRGPEGYHLDLDLPGIDPASVEVGFETGVLTVSAQRDRAVQPERQALLLERPHGTVTRQVELPEPVDALAALVGYRDGVLSLTVPFPAAPGAPAQDGTSTSDGESAPQDGTAPGGAVPVEGTAAREGESAGAAQEQAAGPAPGWGPERARLIDLAGADRVRAPTSGE